MSVTPVHLVRAEREEASRKARLRLSVGVRLGNVVSSIRRIGAAAQRSSSAASASQAVNAKYAHLATLETVGDQSTQSQPSAYGIPLSSPSAVGRDRSVGRSRSSLSARLTSLAKHINEDEKRRDQESRILEQAIKSFRRAGSPAFPGGHKPRAATHQHSTLVDQTFNADARAVALLRRQSPGRTSNAEAYLRNGRLTPNGVSNATNAHSSHVSSALVTRLSRSLSKSLME